MFNEKNTPNLKHINIGVVINIFPQKNSDKYYRLNKNEL